MKERIQLSIEEKLKKLNYRKYAYLKLKSKRAKEERLLHAYSEIAAIALGGSTKNPETMRQNINALLRDIEAMHKESFNFRDAVYASFLDAESERVDADVVLHEEHGVEDLKNNSIQIR